MKLVDIINEDKNSKVIKFLGLKVYSKEVNLDRVKEKWILGVLKKKKDSQRKRYYFLGIKFYEKNYPFNMHSIATIVKNETKAAIMVSNLHQNVFPQYENMNIGKEVVVVATGPSLKYYTPIKNAVHIGVNRAFKASGFEIDYLFMIDWRVIQDYIDDIEQYDCVKFCGQHSDPNFSVLSKDMVSCHIPDSVVHRLGAYKYYSNTFDSKIFHDISSCPLMDFGSAIFPAIHFALYTNPQKLYLIGCDCTLGGYWDGKEQKIKNEWLMDTTIKGYEKVKRFAYAYYPETEIISINPVNLKGMFKDVYTESYIKENKDIAKELNSELIIL